MYLGWATTVKKKPIRPSSAETRRGQILALLPERLALATLTARRCQALYDELRERPTRFGRPPSAAYHQQALQESRRLLAWCTSKGWLRHNPLVGVEAVGERQSGKPQLTTDEFLTMLVYCLEQGSAGDNAALQVALLMYFGLRRGETGLLQARHISTKAWVIEVPPFKCRKKVLVLGVPEDPLLRAALQRLVTGRFPLEQLFPVVGPTVRRRVHVLCMAAGVPKVCAQGLRGSQSTVAARLGVSAAAIAANLAHHPAVNRQHYTQAGAVESGTAAMILELKR